MILTRKQPIILQIIKKHKTSLINYHHCNCYRIIKKKQNRKQRMDFSSKSCNFVIANKFM